MGETVEGSTALVPVDETPVVERPWDGRSDPFHALHDWVKGEFDKRDAKKDDKKEKKSGDDTSG